MCGRGFPIIVGIPDLRIAGPTEWSDETDRDEALLLAREASGRSWAELLALNDQLSIEKGKRSPEILHFYRELSETAEQREHNRWRELACLATKHNFIPPEGGVALDLGCGMGSALPLLAAKFDHVVAIDVSLKQLVLARHRCHERGIQNITFLCACAEKVPLTSGCTRLVWSTDVIEHVASVQAYLTEVNRVLEPRGLFWASTPNRYTVLRESHVRLWGVGFVPRRWQRVYVRMFARTNYDGIVPLSYRELKIVLKHAFEKHSFGYACDLHAVLERHPGIPESPLWRLAKRLWTLIDSAPSLRGGWLLLEESFYPQFRICAWAGSPESTGAAKGSE